MRENAEERGSGLVHTVTKRIYHSVVTNATDDTVLLSLPCFRLGSKDVARSSHS